MLISRSNILSHRHDPWIIPFIILQGSIAALSAFFSWWVLAGLIGLIIIGFSLRYPVQGLIVLILLHVLILRQNEGISVSEVIYGCFFALFFGSWLFQKVFIKNEELVRNSREWWLVSFLILCFFSFATAFVAHGKMLQWFRDLVPFLTLLLYFPLVDVMRNRRNAVLLLISFLLVAAIIGVQNIFNYRENLRAAVYFWEIAGGRQVANEAFFFSGIILLLGLFFHVSSLRLRIAFVGLLLFFGLTLIVTFSRGYWIGTILGIIVSFFLFDFRKKFAFVVSFAIFLIAALAIFYMLFGSTTTYLEKSIFMRASTISRMQGDVSLLNRLSEAKSLIGYILRNPITGYGLGATFSYFNIIHFVTIDTFYSHNAYLFIWFKLGIFAVISFLGFYFANLRVCWKIFRSAGQKSERGILTAATAILIAMIPLSMSSPQFIQKDSLLVIALITSYVTVMAEELTAQKIITLGNKSI